MYSFQPVKDKAYTLDDDVLMKKGYHRMPDGSMMRDEDHIMKKGKRGQKQKQKQKQSVVIRNVINIDKKQRRQKPKPKPKTEKREIRPLPSYSISTGASGASFTPFYPPAPMYRNMVITSPPTTNDDITTSQKRTAELMTGTSLNNIQQKADKENTLDKIEDVITKNRKLIEDFNSPYGMDKRDEEPPSYIGSDKILDSIFDPKTKKYIKNTPKNRKKIENYEIIEDAVNLATNLIQQEEDYDNTPLSSRLKRKPIMEEDYKDNSTPSDENMSSRVQSLKRGHIVPMLARYI